MNVQKNSVHMLSQAWSSKLGLRGREYFPQWGRMGDFAGGFLSLVTNSSLKLRMNICILELPILFFKDLLFILHTSNRILIFLRNIDFSHISHCLVLTLDMSLISWLSYMIHYSFFPKIRECYFHKPI